MITFKPITPASKKEITTYTIPGAYRDNNLSICNLCSWHFLNDSCFAIVDRMLVIRFTFHNGQYIYTLPFGKGDITTALELLHQETQELGQPLMFFGSLPELKDVLEKYFPSPFEYDSHRDHYDYLYLRTSLAELKGREYQPKRNHANRFRKTYSYEYIPLTPDILPHCLELAEKWCMDHDCQKSKSLRNEQKAMAFAMKHFRQLELLGGALRVNGEIIAFTYGAPVNHDTFCVHIEKADTGFDGAYAVINQEFAAHIPEKYTYINREEDLGIPGLRKAKLSYQPELLLEKCLATCQPE